MATIERVREREMRWVGKDAGGKGSENERKPRHVRARI
jgi:hypothetical protein